MNKMKTAYIITMHCPLNYGAVLQAYALQTYLESQGVKTKIIDYNPHYIVYDQSYMYVGDERLKKYALTRWLYRLIKFPVKYRRRNTFSYFRKNELHLTDRYETFEEIKNANLDADCFICGSDQIWNTTSNSHLDPAYFLQFVENRAKCSSYAASGNLPIRNDVKSQTFPMIDSLRHISMREEETINVIQLFISKPIIHVCDPVFLLDPKEWKKLNLRGNTFNKKEKYVLVYPIGGGVEETMQKAYEVAKLAHLPLYCISQSQRRDSRIDKKINCDPYNFISLIDNADFVVTNSFHGTSFCILFEKPFITCVAKGANQRITSLLRKADLLERLNLEDNKMVYNAFIDFREAKANLTNYINISKEYIKQMIDE